MAATILDELINQVRADLFDYVAAWIKEHGELPLTYVLLHGDFKLEFIVLPDAKEETKADLAETVKKAVSFHAFVGSPLKATFLLSDAWFAQAEEGETLQSAADRPASTRANRREVVLVSSFSPHEAQLIGRYYRRSPTHPREITWEEELPTSHQFRYESRFDPWRAKRKAN